MYRIVLIAKNDKAVAALKKFGHHLVEDARVSDKKIEITTDTEKELEFEIIETDVD
jgi:hypothetical protein